jgi:xanthine dehydrogenase accessory factor
MISGEFASQVERLIAQRRPFVLATVVRALRPTSVRPGDAAIVLPDGTIDGFVGGVCATSSVRLHSLRALETGEPLLLRLVPGDDQSGSDGGDDGGGDPAGTIDGGVVERNPCLSGGSLEIFLEPHLPATRLVVFGDSPIAAALRRVGAAAGYDCEPSVAADGAALVEGAAAGVVASHGSGEEPARAAALSAGVPSVALVASARRGAAVRAELEVPEELRAQLHTPAGLEIGAVSPDEIAISILAELVAEQHASPVDARPEVVEAIPTAVREAVDPVCGMRVAVTDATPQLLVGDESLYFCCEGCRDRYAQEHAEAVVVR